MSARRQELCNRRRRLKERKYCTLQNVGQTKKEWFVRKTNSVSSTVSLDSWDQPTDSTTGTSNYTWTSFHSVARHNRVSTDHNAELLTSECKHPQGELGETAKTLASAVWKSDWDIMMHSLNIVWAPGERQNCWIVSFSRRSFNLSSHSAFCSHSSCKFTCLQQSCLLALSVYMLVWTNFHPKLIDMCRTLTETTITNWLHVLNCT